MNDQQVKKGEVNDSNSNSQSSSLAHRKTFYEGKYSQLLERRDLFKPNLLTSLVWEKHIKEVSTRVSQPTMSSKIRQVGRKKPYDVYLCCV